MHSSDVSNLNRAAASHGPLIVRTDEAPTPAAPAEVIVQLPRRTKHAYLYLHDE
jgi:hypothetical protein